MVAYPTVKSVLEFIDSEGHFSALNFPVVIFADELTAWSVKNVNQVPILDHDFYVSQIGMTSDLAFEFMRVAARLAHSAEREALVD